MRTLGRIFGVLVLLAIGALVAWFAFARPMQSALVAQQDQLAAAQVRTDNADSRVKELETNPIKVTEVVTKMVEVPVEKVVEKIIEVRVPFTVEVPISAGAYPITPTLKLDTPIAPKALVETAPKLVAEVSIEGQEPTKVYSPQVGDGGLCWFYAGPGLSQVVSVTVKLLEGSAFAADADAIKVGDKMLGKQNDADDVIVFADSPGTYNLIAYSVGLCVANQSPAPAGKADKVVANRDFRQDGRSMYWLGSAGEITKVR